MANEVEKFVIWHGLLMAEVAAACIALATTIVPGKTRADYSFADHFFQHPSFVQEWLVNFLAINIILIVLAVGIGIFWRKSIAARANKGDQ